jgi:SAM-dependent methyltransferase
LKKHNFVVDYSSSVYADKTNPSGVNRFSWRTELILANNREAIKDKKILDLACNTGRMGFPCLELGAKSVTGVEARTELIEAGKELISKTPWAEQMQFIQGDLFNYLKSLEPGQYDTIMCLGFLYHTVRQVDFFRQISRLRPSSIIIDTSVSKNYWWFGRKSFGKPPALFLAGYENPEETRNTTDDDGLVFWPTTSFLEEMMKRIGYEFTRVDFKSSVKDWSDMNDYKKGTRAAYYAIDIRK